MNNVVPLPKRNIQHALTLQLMVEWDLWCLRDSEEHPPGTEFHYEQIHAELNRRGEGEYCAV